MKRFIQINFWRFHFLLAKNDYIKEQIKKGRSRTSFHIDRVPHQVFVSARINHFFIDMDWI